MRSVARRGGAGLVMALVGMLAAGSLAAQAPTDVKRVDPNPRGRILSGVAVPANRAVYHTSGTTPPMVDSTAARGTRERFGDTYTQGVNTLRRIEENLKGQGLSMKDVIFLRVYLVADKLKGNAFDFDGWNKAYGEFFNTPQNPVKVARSTVGVAWLADPDLLIEIEAVAVYPN
ncbi:MAG: RidA family protein [Gemmatimonadales bacterium]|nr:RidA family protein [Gemmatimonadales bacterium]